MRYLLILLALSFFAFGQTATVKSIPQWHESIQVYSDTVKATTVTTNTVSAKEWNGSVTLFFVIDSLTGSTNYGDLTVEYELYDKQSGVWYHYYSDSDNNTDLVTIGGAKVRTDGVFCRMNDASSWSVADSVRWKLTQASADTMVVALRVGGQ